MVFPARQSLLFAALYFCEGAPIGFLWWALPAYWKSAGLAVDRIATITAVLVLPWSLKWLWAPLVDWSASHWPYRRWIIAAQGTMGLALLALPGLDPQHDFWWLIAVLLGHALAAATQDVSIDALCISMVGSERRGSVNGWMQAGMLLGRALFGGGALLLIAYTSLATMVALLVTMLWSVASILALWPTRRYNSVERICTPATSATATVNGTTRWADLLRDRRIWLGLAFALLAGTAFESVGALLGPFLIEAGMTLEGVGAFQLGPLAGALALGALLGGRVADRFGHLRMARYSLLAMIAANVVLGAVHLYAAPERHASRLAVVVAQYTIVGVFTASSYALFMDLVAARWKATMFSAFMGATNACEAGSAYVAGKLAVNYGYGPTFIIMVVPSLLGFAVLTWLERGGRTIEASTTPASDGSVSRKQTDS